MAKKTERMYLAGFRVHWPTGPVTCCWKHAEGLMKLNAVMGGGHIAVYRLSVQEILDPENGCANCRTEDKE